MTSADLFDCELLPLSVRDEAVTLLSLSARYDKRELYRLVQAHGTGLPRVYFRTQLSPGVCFTQSDVSCPVPSSYTCSIWSPISPKCISAPSTRYTVDQNGRPKRPTVRRVTTSMSASTKSTWYTSRTYPIASMATPTCIAVRLPAPPPAWETQVPLSWRL